MKAMFLSGDAIRFLSEAFGSSRSIGGLCFPALISHGRALVLGLLGMVAFQAASAQVALPEPDGFTKARMDYAKLPDFNPMWKMNPLREEVIEAYKKEDFAKVFELSGAWLKQCPVDADIHFIRASAASRLGDIAATTRHMNFAYGLLASIVSSGDGKTAKTAFRVISIAEEYSLLNDFGAKLIKQSLVEGPCDAMECELPDGSKVTYYFNVSISMDAMAREMKLK